MTGQSQRHMEALQTTQTWRSIDITNTRIDINTINVAIAVTWQERHKSNDGLRETASHYGGIICNQLVKKYIKSLAEGRNFHIFVAENPPVVEAYPCKGAIGGN